MAGAEVKNVMDKSKPVVTAEDVESLSEEHGCDMDVTNSSIDNEYNGNICADIPAQVERFLDFITFNQKGNLLLGSSNLTGRYWDGSVWYYDDPKLAPGVVEAKAGQETAGGACDGVFVTDNTAIVGIDGGNLLFLTLTTKDERVQIVQTANADDHTNTVVSIRLMAGAKSAITASMDCSIRLWDCETTALNHCYIPAHSLQVYCVAPHPTHDKLFLSCSLDGNVLMWDQRCSKPASCIYRDYDDVPTSVVWMDQTSESSGENVLVGTRSGSIHLRDSKTLNHHLFSDDLFNRPIFRMVRNNFKSSQVAVCADDTHVRVYEVEQDKIVTRYENDLHKDFVRGLAWQNETTLFSCGWDKAVHTHLL